MSWVRAGTVAVTNNSQTVIGTNADFATNVRVGDAFVGPDGRLYEVINVASATVLSISPVYQGATASAASYSIMPVQGYSKTLADAFNNLNMQFGPKLAALGTTGNYDVLPVNKGGTAGTDPASARSGLGLGAVATDSIVPVLRGGTGGKDPASARQGLGLGAVATDSVVPVARGGTGGTDAASARAGLGLGAVATDAIVPVARGGTGGTTASAARSALGLGSAAVAPILGVVNQVAGVPTGAVLERGSNANGEYVKLADGTLICTLIGQGSIGFNNPSNIGFTWTYPMPFIALGFVTGNLVGVLGVSKQVTTVSAYNRSNAAASICAFSLGQFTVADAASIYFDCLAIGRWF
ncbi:hypothetical protein ACQKP5_06585 [Pseudomonas vancouverensis]|uniref:hypothetical protein n=1 Tax=Pseudomonas vancouverensis TaxID=95300 RepID=UPI003D0863A8